MYKCPFDYPFARLVFYSPTPRLSEQAYGRDAKHLGGKQPLGAASGKPSYMVKANLQQRSSSSTSTSSSEGNRPAAARPHSAASSSNSTGAAKPFSSKPVAKAPSTAAPLSASSSSAFDASLHPSWAARKQQKTTAAFSGQKVVFDD